MPPKKDVNKPKGRTSAYAFFVKERRNMYREKGQDVQFTEFSKECAELWKNSMDEDQKTKYVAMAEEDRKRFEQEMAEYVPPADAGGKGKKGGKRRKREKDPNQPKRSMSAFFWFAQQKRPKLKEQNPTATVGEIAKQLGAAWKIMTSEQKAPYEKSAKEDHSRYDREMAEYKKNKSLSAAAAPDEDEEEYSDEDED